jgi:DNA-binding LytR/AlgR family response regulator
MTIRSLIIDDEPIARDILQKYCAHFPEIVVVESCGNALDAKRIIERLQIDLLFLDINMPILDGLSFMKTLAKPPLVVFTTAYKEFAHSAFDIDAVDYLLKPFSLERFIVAIDKAKRKLNPPSLPAEMPAGSNHTFIKSEGKIYQLYFNEISYAEANGNNVRIVTDGSTINPVMTLNSLEDLLPKKQFARLHRSFIVNKNKITHIEGNRVFIKTKEIPVGASYKDDFMDELGLK